MNTLTTRKIVLGILITLVLAFSVQGTADAYELTKSTNPIALLPIPSSGTTSEQSFTFKIKFTKAEGEADDTSTTDVSNDAKYEVAIDTVLGLNIENLTVSGLTDTDTVDGTATVDPPSRASTYTVTVKYTLDGPSDGLGEKDFDVSTISDITLIGGGNPVYTAYGVRPPQDVINLEFAAASDDVEIGYSNTNNQFYLDQEVSVTLEALDHGDDTFMGDDGEADTPSHVLVEFQRIWGSGTLYEDLDDDSTTLDPGRRLTTTAKAVTDGTSYVAKVRLRMGRGSTIIRASIRGANTALPRNTHDITYFYGGITPKKVSGEDQIATASTQLAEPLVVEFRDWYPNPSSGTAIRNQEIDFTTSGGMFRPHPDNPDLTSGTVTYPASTIKVKTDNSGQAKVYGVLGTAGSATTFTATLTGTSHTAEFSFTPQAAADAASIEIDDGDGQTGVEKNRPAPDPLVVIVRDTYGLPKSGERVTFNTDSGLLLDPLSADPGTITPPGAPGDTARPDPTTQNRAVYTDNTGKASIRYNVGNTSGAKTVRASIRSGIQQVVFNINGTGSSGDSGDDDGDDEEPTITRTLDIDVSGSGSTREVTVTALQNGVSQRAIFVELRVSGSGASLSRTSGGTPLESTLTLPQTAGTYTLRASTTADYTTATEDVTRTLPGSLSLGEIGARAANGGQAIQVTVREANGSLASGSVTVTLSGVVNRTVTTTNGTGRAQVVLPTTGGSVVLRATGYNDGSYTFPAGGQTATTTTDTTTTTTTTTTVEETQPEPASIRVSGPANRSGTVDTQIDAPLLVQVLDADGDGVENVRVIFRVREGRGRLSQRGNGRAIAVQTNSDGHARADFTPLSDGTITVEAEVTGVTRKVTFTITTDDAAPTGAASVGTYTVGDSISALASGFPSELSGASFQSRGGQRIFTFSNKGKIVQGGITYTCSSVDGCTIQGQRVTKGTIEATRPGTTPPSTGTRTPSTGDTPSTTVNPVLNAAVDTASRSPMLWVSGGKIYALVGSEVKVFISGVENAINLAIGGGKVYWTAKTSDTHGTLNSANLDGTGAKELRSLWGVPRGIAVDTAGSKLYWVDAANRLQSSNLEGLNIENVLRNLSDPQDVVLAGGNVYWIGNGSGTDTLSFITLSDPKKVIHPVAATSGTYGGLAIAGGKVYWTEQTSDTHGTLHSANLDGTGVAELRDDPIWGAPVGIAVDTARSMLYWTDAVGRLQRSNLDGSGIHNVVKGLGLPGDMVLSNNITAPIGTASTTTSKTSTTGSNKYDINADGTVDSKDSDVLIVAVAARITDAKYDVNGDGKVDINDVVAVTANRDKGTASAPALLGTKLGSVEVERLQEQIDLLIATGDRSPAAMRTLVYLQQLIVMARPEKTQLLANYPNPFNPETWIPYELATDTDVRITIYNAQGIVIRTLHLGQQSAGYYTDRQRAAYWDGRNALGEQVASGIYFYQFETDEMSSLRKMLILK